MGFVDTLSEFFTVNKKREVEQRSFLEDNSYTIKEFLITLNNLGDIFIKSSELKLIKEKYKGLYEICRKKKYKKISNQDFVEFVSVYSNLDSFINEKNEIFINKEILENKALLDNIDGKSLDNQQRNAVVINNDANLIIAGAGSGKTLTIAAKVKYLVDSKGIDPSKILLISFTNKAAAEMQERITKKLNIAVESKTFHKLGLDIISKAQGYKPAVYSDLPKQIVDYFKIELIKDKSKLSDILLFFGLYLEVPKPRDAFKTMGEQIDYNKSCDLETMKGKINKKANSLKKEKLTLNSEQVKSIEELLIANFLFLNGVEYTYEKPYEYKEQESGKRQYQPDFYLEEYGIYLEHFGITKDNKVPWLDPIEEEKYLEGIEWKRETHKKNNTTLIETYSYYNTEGRLLEELDRILKNSGIKYKSVDYEGIYKNLLMQDEKKFIEFKKLVNTFINLCKSNNTTPSNSSLINDLSRGRNRFEINRATLFLKIVDPIFEYYQRGLKQYDAIDFNDMINLATNLVKNKKVVFDYEHIIIDEYQDISKGRFNLIKEIRSQSDAIVTAVGDDWQSIFRFAGSDLHLFTRLDHYFGAYSIIKIERTYRNSQELIDIAGQFVMKNPEQIKKNLKSELHNDSPLRFIGYEQFIDEAMGIAIDEIVNSDGPRSEVLILGRNNFDIDLLNHSSVVSIKQISAGEIKIMSLKYPKLAIKYLTVHKSKGLESDNVILINLENKQIGFPNKIADDPILSLMLASNEEYEFAEERRLFYVALTRTKNRTYLLVPENNKSIFAKELIEFYKIKHAVTYNNELNSEKTMCPKCKTGHLVMRKDVKNKYFLGCSNYPLCDNSYKELELLANPVKCDVCGGFMVKKKGKYGEFIGCTNFPFCKNKITPEKK